MAEEDEDMQLGRVPEGQSADFAMEAMAAAGAALEQRLLKLETTSGNVGLMFLMQAEAEEIKYALGAVPEGGGGDPAMRRVLIEEMDLFIAGLSHEIESREAGEDDGA